ncbi:MAG: ribosomal protein S12 methylthiotransferase RimO [Spirochaetes bacterium GWF1_51_8]|nr:MAG: ribosomal protein S12 methylthiotransferase RimO [Spirochaetes bacterium GWF1_51_8]
MKVFFDALGCPKALVDAEKIASIVQGAEHEIVLSPDDAQVVIVNTCGFIEQAKQESIDTILSYAELKKQRPDLKLIVSGCLTERYRNDLAESIPEIDSMIGVRDISKILKAIAEQSRDILDSGEYREHDFDGSRTGLFSGMNYAYLKISEGCARQCSFCAIPAIRGKLRSRTIEDILNEARFLRENWGTEELILISEDTSFYGIDLYGEKSIIKLLEKLLEIDFHWIRLMYLFPDPVVEEIAVLMKREPRICRYIDIPLQHASAKILASMNRPGNAEEYLEMIGRVRDTVPEISIRSAFITGYPGETEEDHDILKKFLSGAALDRVGFFEYSDEEGTPAFDIGNKVPKRTAAKRTAELMGLQEKISIARLERRIGRVLECVNDGSSVEETGDTTLILRSEYDAPEIDGSVIVKTQSGITQEESFFNVRITGVIAPHDLQGEIVERE